jgi:cytochrome c oxidase assembly protein subunit 11
MRDPRRRTLAAALGVIAVMLGLTAYSPTLYRIFCDVTGFGGTPRRGAESPAASSDRVIVVRFAAEVDAGMPWRFGPAEREIRVRVGEQKLAFYVAENLAREAVSGTALFNVAPAKAGPYFNKIACFCFEEQHLAPGQRADMPVSFFVDPAILADRSLDDVTTITLHYTFFRTLAPKRAPAN